MSPRPFLTLYTPTFRRPRQLAHCLRSVQEQTAVADIEQIVIPDHVGLGIGGMFQRIQDYASAVHGEYVHVLADDDVLASRTVVEQLRDCARANGNPPLIIVKAQKGGATWPVGRVWPPEMGRIDLGCFVVRQDVWRPHASCYGNRYEGDWDFGHAVATSGHKAVVADLLFLVGGVSHGVPEVAA